MKLDLTPVRSSYVAPTFGGDDRLPIDPALQRRMRRPMIIGALIIAFLVVGLGLWASLSPLKTGVTSQGEVRVESNRKTIQHLEGGIVKAILVRSGVGAGCPVAGSSSFRVEAARSIAAAPVTPASTARLFPER